MTTAVAWRAALAVTALLVFVASVTRHPLDLPLPDAGWLAAPAPDRALVSLRALGGLILLNLAAWGAGTSLGRHVPLDATLRVRRLALIGAGFLTLALAALGLAALHLVQAPAIRALVGACAAVGVWDLARRARPRRPTRRELAIALAGTTLLASPLLAAFDADPGWDALTYHLPLAERTAFANGTPITPWSVFSAFPHMMSMLYLLTLELDGVVLSRWLHLEFGVLTALLAVLLARTASPRAGWLAAAALAACPLFAWELGVAYADLTACFFTLLAVALLGPGLTGCAVAGLFAGAAAACRYPSWGVLLALPALLWLPGTWGPADSRTRARASLVACAGALLALGPWIARNVAFTGNPAAPALQSLFAAPGEEFFAPLTLSQNAAFIRSIGPGRGLFDLLALPWRISVQAVPGDYRWFGYSIGPLFLLGALAALGCGSAGRPPLARRLWSAAGLLTLFWFFTAQEPRYLLPALVLTGVAGAIAADAAIGTRRAWLVVPLLAVLHAQLPIWTALPQRYGVALGRLPVAVPPEERAGERLREALGADDRAVLLFEPRAWFFRGLDYIPYHLGNGSPLLAEIHAAIDRPAGPDALEAFFRSLGATHVVVNTRLGPLATPFFVEEYPRAAFEADLAALNAFFESRTDLLLREGSIEARRLHGGPEARR